MTKKKLHIQVPEIAAIQMELIAYTGAKATHTGVSQLMEAAWVHYLRHLQTKTYPKRTYSMTTNKEQLADYRQRLLAGQSISAEEYKHAVKLLREDAEARKTKGAKKDG